MRANVNGVRAEVVQLAQKLAAVFHCRVIRLVVTEPAIDRFEGPLRFGKIHVHAHLALRAKSHRHGTSNHHVRPLLHLHSEFSTLTPCALFRAQARSWFRPSAVQIPSMLIDQSAHSHRQQISSSVRLAATRRRCHGQAPLHTNIVRRAAHQNIVGAWMDDVRMFADIPPR